MSLEVIDKRTPELKLLNIIETQRNNISTLHDDFRGGLIDFNDALDRCKGIGLNLTKMLDVIFEKEVK